jgi:hypothetical protein
LKSVAVNREPSFNGIAYKALKWLGFIRIVQKEISDMLSNAQVRLIASAIALLAGGILANTSNIDVNVSIVIILISSIIFIVEYWRLQKP